MGQLEDVTVVVEPFSFAGDTVITAAIEDLNGLSMEAFMLQMEGDEKGFQALETKRKGDWQSILDAAKKSGKVPADFTLDDTHGLEINPDDQTIRAVILN